MKNYISSELKTEQEKLNRLFDIGAAWEQILQQSQVVDEYILRTIKSNKEDVNLI